MIYVAYNAWGDLIAEADNLNDLLRTLAVGGVDEDEVLIGKVTA